MIKYMVTSFRNINLELAKKIKLIMTDVDGTLLARGNTLSREVGEALHLLQQAGITIGLVSGRTLSLLESMSNEFNLAGPIIAENGAIAKLSPGAELIELGYSRQPAIDALNYLKELYPGAIREREDNAERFIDIVIWADGISIEEIRRTIKPTQLLDSGYILHLMQEGINKGKTLEKILDEMKVYSRDEVMVFGDSVTDLSLFEIFPNNVLIVNPRLPEGQAEIMEKKATYVSEKQYGEGFTETALHIVNLLNAIAAE
ncbi:MAG: HAD-IIB family hydrolase [Dehalococcoidales bacterium]|nr:MAG: HAD-IIB family hydrolase [Dehalococcoidales bacterium]